MAILMVGCTSVVIVMHTLGVMAIQKTLGRLADEELREWKKKVHATFDRLWKEKFMKREMAYQWISKQLGIPRNITHIGMSDVEMCKKNVELRKQELQKYTCN